MNAEGTPLADPTPVWITPTPEPAGVYVEQLPSTGIMDSTLSTGEWYGFLAAVAIAVAWFGFLFWSWYRRR